VIAAAQAGKHILCEKPMTTTVAGCQRMAEVIRSSGITFAMGYTWRFNAGARTIKALLEAGAIGPVRYARGFLSTQAQDPAGWRGPSLARDSPGPSPRGASRTMASRCHSNR